ncbi:MAG: DUF551 domain-containing protein [Pseudomonadota bacterium]
MRSALEIDWRFSVSPVTTKGGVSDELAAITDGSQPVGHHAVDLCMNVVRENNDWQPIETAPLDGTDILTWDGNYHTVLFMSQYGSGWTAGNPRIKYEPTHWQPLPSPPKGE